ncbi:MAG: hypothetical protein GYB49_14375 [Alphaproteobacteria bacterium]|nr:hypothetical protein [Alphaproteobacteria bacterium]|tara:strand:- start:4218 stop:5150 length:933 start_codon:yes stop_codon:yes gene_type:complete
MMFRPIPLFTALLLLNPAFAQETGLPGAEGLGEQPTPCTLQIRPPDMVVYRGALSRGYNSDSDRQHTEIAKVIIEHEGDACPYTLRIQPETGRGTAYMYNGQNTLEFEVSPPGRSGGSGSNMVEIAGNVARGQFQRTVSFDLQIPPGQKTVAGRYVGRLEVSLYPDTSAAGELADRQYMEVVVDVLPRIDASFGTNAIGGQKTTSLNFGKLQKGQKSSIEFSVTANIGYSIKVTSDNSGTLRHEHTTSGIDYSVYLDGTRISVDASSASETLLSSATNSQHSMDFLITSNTSKALAGNYTDRLTLVVSAD